MKLRITAVAMAVSVLAAGPVYAGGAGGCDYGSDYGSSRYTSAEPQEQSEVAKKLASLNVPIGEQTAGQASASAPEKARASTPPSAEKTTAQ